MYIVSVGFLLYREHETNAKRFGAIVRLEQAPLGNQGQILSGQNPPCHIPQTRGRICRNTAEKSLTFKGREKREKKNIKKKILIAFGFVYLAVLVFVCGDIRMEGSRVCVSVYCD